MYLIKKSHPSQKLYFASHLNCYLSNKSERPLLMQIITTIIDHLDLWDSNTCIAFSTSLSSIMTELMVSKNKVGQYLDQEDYDLFTLCLSNFIKAIISMEKTVSDGYLSSFSNCIDSISSSSTSFYKLQPNKEINDLVLQLGKIGQNPYDIKYALFFITCLVRISSEYQEELFECFTSLIHEKQKDIKYEIAYDLRYILKEIDIGYIKSTYYPIMKSYLNETDIVLREIILETLFNNITVCDMTMKTRLQTSLNEIYSSDDSYAISTDFKHLNNIFTSMVKCFYNSIINDNVQDNEGIDYHSLIVLYLRRFLINNARRTNASNSSDDDDDSFNSFSDPFDIDYLFNIFDQISKALIYSNDLLFLITCFNSLLSQINSKNEAEFYNNIANVLRFIPSEFINCKTLVAIFDFLNKDVMDDNIYNNSSNIVNQNNSWTANNSFNYSAFAQVIDIMKTNSNEHFFLMLFGPNNHLTKLIDSFCLNWRNQLAIIKSFSSSVLFYMMSKYKSFPCSLWFKELFDIASKYLILDNVNYLLLVELAKLLARLSKYLLNRDELIDFAYKELLNSQYFYKRRIITSFIEECYSVLSLDLFEEFKLGEHMMKLIDDKTNILKLWAIKFVYENNFLGDWVKAFAKRIEDIKGNLIDIEEEDEELKKKMDLFISRKDNANRDDIGINPEDNLKRKEEERVIKELNSAAIEYALNKKKNSNNNSQYKMTKKQAPYKRRSINNSNNNNNNVSLISHKGSSQKFKKQLLIKTSDDCIPYTPMPTTSTSSNKPKRKSSLTVSHNYEENKIRKTSSILETTKRKCVKLNLLGNHKNS